MEERILSVHVRAEEKSVPIYDVVPESFVDVRCVVVFVVLDVVLMRGDVLSDYSWCWLNFFFGIFIFLGCSSVDAGVLFFAFSATIAFIKSLLKPSKLIIQINKDICT